MHRLYPAALDLSGKVIGAAIEVHKALGPGLLESIYEWALTKELELRGHKVRNQRHVQVAYKGFLREDILRFDLLVDDCELVEVKAVEAVHPVCKAQLLTYMKLLDIPVGLLINFHVIKLKDGISRLILPGANLLD